MHEFHPRAVAILKAEVESKLKLLLETKHLYQSVKIDTSALTNFLEDLKNSVMTSTELLTLEEIHEISCVNWGSPDDPTQYLPILERDFKEVADIFQSDFWAFYTEDDLEKSRALSKSSATKTFFALPTICVPCIHCDAIKPPHNAGNKDMWRASTTFDPISCDVSTNGNIKKCQTFIIPFVCQACKKEPLVFLVRREGLKVTLVGRNHFESPQVAKTVPKEEAKFFGEAIVAFNTGSTLAGLFLLRTTIEQYMRRVIGTKEKLTGDELADQYAKLLSGDFPKSRFPSLRTVYDELSACLHAAVANDDQFIKSRADIEKHFSLLEHFPLIPKTT
jgi:hypothetical protein